MVSKGDLGISYLIAVGVVLFATLSTGITVPFLTSGFSIDVHSPLPVATGLTIAVVFTITGVWMRQSDLDDEMAWPISVWASLGLGVPLLGVLGLSVWEPPVLRPLELRNIASLNIAFGGILGVLSGTLLGLRTEYNRKRTLNQRNTVFLRLFRHDIRNSVNLIQGHLDLLTTDESCTEEQIDVIDDQLEHILRLGEAARKLDKLETIERTERVDLSELVSERIDVVGENDGDVTFETDLRADTVVQANELLATAVDNLLSNAIDHRDGSARVRITVGTSGHRTGAVELTVRDDGPGFPDEELTVHERATETPLEHSEGVGLWLTRWIVEAHEGELTIANAEDGGAVVTMTLPEAQNPGGDPISGVLPS